MTVLKLKPMTVTLQERQDDTLSRCIDFGVSFQDLWNPLTVEDSLDFAESFAVSLLKLLVEDTVS
jgi:hypothetical protein